MDGSVYVGISKNVQQRVAQHNAGFTLSTKTRRPYRLLYTETFSDRMQARAREKELKTNRSKKTDLIERIRRSRMASSSNG